MAAAIKKHAATPKIIKKPKKKELYNNQTQKYNPASPVLY